MPFLEYVPQYVYAVFTIICQDMSIHVDVNSMSMSIFVNLSMSIGMSMYMQACKGRCGNHILSARRLGHGILQS